MSAMTHTESNSGLLSGGIEPEIHPLAVRNEADSNSITPPYHAVLFAQENVLPAFVAMRKEDRRAALVTVVGIEGASPRPLGAQMAVTAEGQCVGYLSGGCLEAAVIEEAKISLREGENRLVRYGKGSRYIDARLPCGSGLDIYIDQAISLEDLVDVDGLIRNRRVLQMETDLDKGTTVFATWKQVSFGVRTARQVFPTDVGAPLTTRPHG